MEIHREDGYEGTWGSIGGLEEVDGESSTSGSPASAFDGSSSSIFRKAKLYQWLILAVADKEE